MGNQVVNYSLADFMAMALPANSVLIEQKLGNNFIGPFMKRLRRLSASFNVHFPELEPAFRKLDLILASGDADLVAAALALDDLTITSLLAGAADALVGPSSTIEDKDVYLLSNDAGWETWTHGSGNRMAPGGGSGEPAEEGAGPESTGARAAFSQCHETVGADNNIWIPEFVGVFEEIDKMLIAAQ